MAIHAELDNLQIAIANDPAVTFKNNSLFCIHCTKLQNAIIIQLLERHEWHNLSQNYYGTRPEERPNMHSLCAYINWHFTFQTEDNLGFH